ncbi:hypothetical protein Tco_1479514, partial [Tanacetum coccineum]
TAINVQKEQSFDLSAGTSSNVKPDNLRVWLLKKLISETSVEVDSKLISKMTFEQNELESLFGPLFDEYFNGENQVVSTSAVTTADASDKRQQQPDSTSSTSTLETTAIADGNFDL